VEQRDPKDLVAVVLPKIDAMPDGTPAHVAFVAWQQDNEDGPVSGSVEVLTDDSLGGVEWRVHRLDREELVIDNDLSGNPDLVVPSDTTCTPNFVTGAAAPAQIGCIPQVTQFLGSIPSYNADFVRRVNPSPRIAGRMEIVKGSLMPIVRDSCKWEIAAVGAQQPLKRYMATTIAYRFGTSGPLKLKLRKLDQPLGKTTDLVTLKPDGLIRVLFGNTLNVFPNPVAVHSIATGQADPHFAAYYDFLQNVANGPIPRRTGECDHPATEDVYCGPGWIKGSTP
jgi:hypothetical protein